MLSVFEDHWLSPLTLYISDFGVLSPADFFRSLCFWGMWGWAKGGGEPLCEVAKTKELVVVSIQVSIQESEVEMVTSSKYLGVHLIQLTGVDSQHRGCQQDGPLQTVLPREMFSYICSSILQMSSQSSHRQQLHKLPRVDTRCGGGEEDSVQMKEGFLDTHSHPFYSCKGCDQQEPPPPRWDIAACCYFPLRYVLHNFIVLSWL